MLRNLAVTFTLISVLPLAGCQSKEAARKDLVQWYVNEVAIADGLANSSRATASDIESSRSQCRTLRREATDAGMLDPKSKTYSQETVDSCLTFDKTLAELELKTKDFDDRLEEQHEVVRKIRARVFPKTLGANKEVAH